MLRVYLNSKKLKVKKEREREKQNQRSKEKKSKQIQVLHTAYLGQSTVTIKLSRKCHIWGKHNLVRMQISHLFLKLLRLCHFSANTCSRL